MVSVATSMGRSANYHLESNWMGVRWGSILFASMVLRDELFTKSPDQMLLNPLFYDSKERIRDHIHASHTPGGWFVESLSYQAYTWRFIAPALIAFENNHNSPVVEVEQHAPRLLRSMDQQVTSIVSIVSNGGAGIKPDLADDNLHIGFDQLALASRLLEPEARPYLRWMFDYLNVPGAWDTYPYILYPILFYPADVPSRNPADRFLHYVDTTQGVVMFRNRFRDDKDMVATFNASANPVHGHAGPDKLTFRITGLGSPWVIGAGRTGEVAGQTNLFPAGDWQSQRTRTHGTLESFDFSPRGIMYVRGSGSCLGVENHTRTFVTDYSGVSGADGLFIISDRSDNGRTWRLNTPEFHDVRILEDGFLLTAPDGASLKATVLEPLHPEISQTTVRYGGKTVRNNPGIGYQGKTYWNNHAIDIQCPGSITVILTLQPADKKHPKTDTDRIWKMLNMDQPGKNTTD